MPNMPPADWTSGWNRHGAQPYTSEYLVLGGLSGREPYPRYISCSVSAATRFVALRDSFWHSPQAARWHGTPDQDRIGGKSDEHVEADETYVGGRTRGEGRGVHHKVLVACAVEVRHRKPGTAQDKRKDGRYAGRVRLAVTPDRSANSLCGFIESAVAPGTLVVTDDWSGYNRLSKSGYNHQAIAECGDPEVAEDFLPIIHLVFANLKTWLIGTHHGVSAKHLQAYLNEFTFRFNRRFYPFNAFRSLLGIAGGAESPTFAELYSGDWVHPTFSGCLR
jgi:transposase-like protein